MSGPYAQFPTPLLDGMEVAFLILIVVCPLVPPAWLTTRKRLSHLTEKDCIQDRGYLKRGLALLIFEF